MGKVDIDSVDENINTLHFALFLNSFTIKYNKHSGKRQASCY